MYDEYFGLKETPFSIAPNPRFLYMSERHREALAHLVYGVGSDGGFILLTGEVGTGKTTISRCLLDQIPENSNVALILNPKLLAGELLASICDDLHIKYPQDNPSIKVLIDCIYEYLLDQNAQGRKTVVIIEEAQNLTNDVLEQLRLLTNLETNQRKLMQIIMLGQPELLEILAQEELRQLEQRITARYHLMPLTQQETADYIEHRLGVAGARERDPIFTASAMKRIFKYTDGVPRKINLLCDRALLGAYVHNVKSVDTKTVKKAAKEAFRRANKVNKRQQGRRMDMIIWSIANLVLMVGVIFLGYAIYTKPEVVAALFNDDQNLQKMSADTLQLIDSQPVEVSASYAFQAVLMQWDSQVFGLSSDAGFCDSVQEYGLRCLKKKGNLRSLRHYNRPAVLTLVNNKGKNLFAGITQLNNGFATLHINGNTKKVRLADLESRWFGEYTIVWRPPPDFNGSISPGSTGKDVAWLANLLAAVNGQSMTTEETLTYDDKLVEQVRAFQLKKGLVSDGIAGAQTLIHLNTEAKMGVPVLTKSNDHSAAVSPWYELSWLKDNKGS